MKIDVDTLSSIQRRITVELTAAAVGEEFSHVYENLSRRARIRGFRPGKVPRSVLQRFYGDEVKSEVLSRLVEQSLSEIIKDKQLQVVSRPEIDANDVEEGKAFVFSAVVEVKPEIQVKNYSGMEVEKIRLAMDDAQIETALHRLQEEHGQLEPVEERDIVEEGDFVLLDFSGSLDGKPFPGARQEAYSLELGKGKALPEFERALVGLKTGHKHTINVPYPDDYFNRELAGRTVVFSVTVQSIKKKVLPHLDDEFAKDYGESSTLEELKDKIRARLESEIREIQTADLKERLLDRISEANSFEVPPSMVNRQVQYLIERQARLSAQELPSSTEAFSRERQDLQRQAQRQVRATLLVEKIAETENVKVSEEEVRLRIERIARAAGERGTAVREIYQKSSAVEDLRSQMIFDKTLEFLLDRAKIKEVEPPVDAQDKKR